MHHQFHNEKKIKVFIWLDKPNEIHLNQILHLGTPSDPKSNLNTHNDFTVVAFLNLATHQYHSYLLTNLIKQLFEPQHSTKKYPCSSHYIYPTREIIALPLASDTCFCTTALGFKHNGPNDTFS